MTQSGTQSAPNPRHQLTTRAVIVWLGATLTYLMAVTGRTSFGVAAVAAMERFQVDTAHIAVFTSLQVGVYALAQIPTGIAIDRFGAKKMLVGGAIVMAAGQIILGFATSYPLALIARALIGAGDATAFLAAMRLIPVWFPLKHTPLFAQLTGSIGQGGQFLSALPFYAVLHNLGWSPAFVGLGAVIILVTVAASIMVADTPDTPHTTSTATTGTTGTTTSGDTPTGATQTADTTSNPTKPTVRQTLTHPVVWEAFFMHGASMVTIVSFTLLWGVPTMTQGMGLDPKTAGLVLILNPAVMIICSPLAGVLSARLGIKRDIATVIFVTAMMVGFAVFYISPTPPSLGAIVTTIIVVSLFNPCFNFGFDSVREVLPHSVVATGTGFANMGGFISTMLATQGMGLIMSEPLSWADFHLGWWAINAVWLVDVLGIIITAILLRRRLATRQ